MRLKTLFFVFIMAAGAMGGAPLNAAGSMNGNEVCPMKCCKKAAKAKEKARHHQNNFCRLTSCSETMPSAPSSPNVVQSNPAFTTAAETGFLGILNSTRPKDIPNRSYAARIIPPGHPLFIKTHSLLI